MMRSMLLLALFGCPHTETPPDTEPPTIDTPVVEPPRCPDPDADADADGVACSADCDDTQLTVHPGALEIPNDGVDQDCDGADLTPTLAMENADLPGEAVVRFDPPPAECPPLDGVAPEAQTPMLGRYCRYLSDTSDFRHLRSNPFPGGGGLVDVDRLAIAPMTLQNDLRSHWLAMTNWGAGWATRCESDTCTPPVAHQRMSRLVLLDTLPAVDAPDASSSFDAVPLDPAVADPTLHGVRMFGTAITHVCYDGAACGVQLYARQVLGARPQRGANADQWGSFLDLADAIVAAVDTWEADKTSQEDLGQLVLALALAWHPVFGGGMSGGAEIGVDPITLADGTSAHFDWSLVDPEQFPLGVRAVWDALNYARCHGVLTVAASGNITPGPFGGRGPMLPAAWEAFPAERLPACEGQLPAEQLPPLVVAAGGLGPAATTCDPTDPACEQSVVLAEARPDSTPVFNAWAYATVHKEPPSVGLSLGDALTGTSVSTLVIASTAALLAAEDASLGPMDVLRRMAAARDLPADLPNDSPERPEFQRHETAIEVSPAFQSTAARLGVQHAIWVRPCGLLSTAFWRCNAPQMMLSPLTTSSPPAEGDVAAWSEDLTADVTPFFSPFALPSLITQPGETMCPECFTTSSGGAVHARFPVFAGSLISIRFRGQVTRNGTTARIQSAPLPIPTPVNVDGLDWLELNFRLEGIQAILDGRLEVVIAPVGQEGDASTWRTTVIHLPGVPNVQ